MREPALGGAVAVPQPLRLPARRARRRLHRRRAGRRRRPRAPGSDRARTTRAAAELVGWQPKDRDDAAARSRSPSTSAEYRDRTASRWWRHRRAELAEAASSLRGAVAASPTSSTPGRDLPMDGLGPERLDRGRQAAERARAAASARRSSSRSTPSATCRDVEQVVTLLPPPPPTEAQKRAEAKATARRSRPRPAAPRRATAATRWTSHRRRQAAATRRPTSTTLDTRAQHGSAR